MIQKSIINKITGNCIFGKITSLWCKKCRCSKCYYYEICKCPKKDFNR